MKPPSTIVILTYGSRGDVQPLIALGVGLTRRGYRVRLAAPETFAPLVASYGLEFAPLPGDPRALSRTLVERGAATPLAVIGVLFDHALPLAERMLVRVEEVCRGADAVVHTFAMTTAGHEVARRLGVPDFSVQLFPVFAPTGAFPALMFPGLPLGAPYNRLTHQLNTAVFWWGSRLAYAWLRRRNRTLPPLSSWPFSARNRRPPLLFAISPRVLPKPPDWGPDVYVTGYFTLSVDRGWTPPTDLAAFLAEGPPPVYVGFGSMVSSDAPRLVEVAQDALDARGVRGILGLGWGGGRPENGSDGVFVLAQAPHEWLFPRLAAIVHHGGAGTTGAALRSGRPQVIVPFTSDQPFWADRIHQLGVSARPIPWRDLSVARLANALGQVVGDRELAQRAEQVGAQVRAEAGVERAVEIVQKGLMG